MIEIVEQSRASERVPPTQPRQLSKQGRPIRVPKSVSFQPDGSTAESLPSTISSSQYMESTAIFDGKFDQMMENFSESSLYVAVPPILQELIQSSHAIIWIPLSDVRSFYAPAIQASISADYSILLSASTSKAVIVSSAFGNEFASVKSSLPQSAYQMYFPLYLHDDTIVAVVQLLRDASQHAFDDNDMQIANYFMKKFVVCGSVFFESAKRLRYSTDFIHILPSSDIGPTLSSSLTDHFSCKAADFWKKTSADIFKFDQESGSFQPVPRNSVGVIGFSLKNICQVNVQTVRYHQNFSFSSDLYPEEAFLSAACQYEGAVYGVALRGRTQPFTSDDEVKLTSVVPFIARSIEFSSFRRPASSSQELSEDSLKQILDMASIFPAILSMESLATSIQNHLPTFISAEGAKVLYYDSDVFFGDFGTIKPARSISLEVIATGKPFLCPNADAENSFNAAIDAHSGLEVKNIIAVPIPAEGGAKTVITVWNKKGRTFNSADQDLLEVFAKFVSAPIRNVRLFQKTRLSVSGFVNLLSAQSINELIEKACKAISAVGGFIVDSGGHVIASYGEVPVEYSAAASAVESEKIPLTYSIVPTVKRLTGGKEFSGTQFVTCAPMDGRAFGMLFSGSASSETATIWEGFALFVATAVSIKFSEEIKTDKFIVGSEESFKLPVAKRGQIASIDFNISELADNDLIGATMFIFNSYGVLAEYGISDSQFVSFLRTLSSKYGDRPYQSWRHAVDCLQFMNSLLFMTSFHNSMTKDELLSLMLAAIAHDVGPIDIPGKFGPRCGQAIDYLASRQCIMEATSCRTLATILSAEGESILSKMAPELRTTVWERTMNLILSTNCGQHASLMRQVAALQKRGPLDATIEGSRLLVMQLILKCSDLSSLCRPPSIADSRLKDVCEEFFLTGDLERSNFIQFSGQQNRLAIDVEHSRLPLIECLYVPIFELLARTFDTARPAADRAIENFTRWKGAPPSRKREYDGRPDRNPEY